MPCSQSSSLVTKTPRFGTKCSSRWKGAIAQAQMEKLMALRFTPWITMRTRWLLIITSSSRINHWKSRTLHRVERITNRFRASRWTQINPHQLCINNKFPSRMKLFDHLRLFQSSITVAVWILTSLQTWRIWTRSRALRSRKPRSPLHVMPVRSDQKLS